MSCDNKQTKMYVGTRRVKATPMSRQDYNNLRGWRLPDDEDGNDEGYLIEHTDGGKPNTLDYEGYVSWSPKDTFDNTFTDAEDLVCSYGTTLKSFTDNRVGQSIGDMGRTCDIGDVPALLVEGRELVRQGWDDSKECIYLGSEDDKSQIMLRHKDGITEPWSPDQSDVTADDWMIVPK